MSIFHETMRDILEDVQKFLNITLQKEHLSAASMTHKESLLMKIHHLRMEYPQLHLQLILEPRDETGLSNPPPYIDMQGNAADTEYVYSDTLVDEYEICDKGDSGRNSKLISEEGDTASEYKEHDIPAIPACDLSNIIKCGYLEKKGKDRLGGWLNLFQKRFVALRDNILILYNKSTDKRPYSTLPLSGYDVRPASLITRDFSKKEACFELVGPGKKTYQFVASSSSEAKSWIDAVQKAISDISREAVPVSTASVHPPSVASSRANELQIWIDSLDGGGSHAVSKKANVPTNKEQMCDDIYEIVEDGSTDTLLVEDDLYEDANSEHVGRVDGGVACALPGVGHPLDWYVGLWDCSASAADELNFSRGDLLRVIDKGYDEYKWWIAEFNGHVGLVPKQYLMSAYEPVEMDVV